MVTERLAPLPLQLPQARYSLPKFWTVKPSMVTWEAPLFWMTLSSAPRAPPPLMRAVPEPLRVRASSQTSVHQTSVIC